MLRVCRNESVECSDWIGLDRIELDWIGLSVGCLLIVRLFGPHLSIGQPNCHSVSLYICICIYICRLPTATKSHLAKSHLGKSDLGPYSHFLLHSVCFLDSAEWTVLQCFYMQKPLSRISSIGGSSGGGIQNTGISTRRCYVGARKRVWPRGFSRQARPSQDQVVWFWLHCHSRFRLFVRGTEEAEE